MRTVYWDVDTQLDFVSPAGSLYVKGAEKIIPRIAQLNRYAMANGVPLVSTMDAHLENDVEFRTWAHHCIVGTLGQRKPAETLVGQILFPKVTTDVFESPALAPLLRELAAERFVVYGVVTEICVRYAALGLLKTGAKVEIVPDAIQHLNEGDRDDFLTTFHRNGGALFTS